MGHWRAPFLKRTDGVKKKVWSGVPCLFAVTALLLLPLFLTGCCRKEGREKVFEHTEPVSGRIVTPEVFLNPLQCYLKEKEYIARRGSAEIARFQKESKDAIKRLAQVDTGSFEYDELFKNGLELAKQKRYREAISELQSIIEANPGNRVLAIKGEKNLALACFLAGDKAGYAEHLKKHSELLVEYLKEMEEADLSQ